MRGSPLQLIARINGEVVSPSSLWRSEFNFGQFRWPAPIGEYEIEIPQAEFIERLDPAYRQCVAELQADDELVPDQPSFPLRDAGYPPLAALPDYPAALAEAVTVYLLGALLDSFLPFSPAQARFMVNSVESVSTSPAAVVVRGRGYFGAPGFAARD